MSKRIFVGNISFNTSEDALRDYFAQAGTIDDCFLPSDRETGRPRGFAFITFTSEDEASSAIERFNGEELDGRALRVDVADSRPRREGGGGGGPRGGGFGGGGGGGFGGGGGGGFGGPPSGDDRFKKAGGSRRGLRGKKRSL